MASKRSVIPSMTAEAVLVEDIKAPEVFATSVASYSTGEGTVTMSLASLRWDYSSQPPTRKMVVICRLTMPMSGADLLGKGLQEFMAQHVSRVVVSPGAARVQ